MQSHLYFINVIVSCLSFISSTSFIQLINCAPCSVTIVEFNNSKQELPHYNSNCSIWTYEFEKDKYILNYTLEFTNRVSVQLIGKNGTKLTYHASKVTALHFTNVSNISIRNIDLTSVGLGNSSFESNSTIFITTGNSVLLDNVAITYSKGYGLSIWDVVNVTIVDTRVNNNHRGLYLYTDTMQQSYITLVGTNFTNNSFNSIHIAETNIKIVIKNCAFAKNYGIIGGGLYVLFAEVLQVDLVTDSSTFEGNQVQSRGGGLCIYVIIMHKNFPPSIKLLVKGTLFYNNSAEYGGGFYFYLMSTIKIYTNTVIENCTWEANKAFYEAAITLYVSFQTGIKPLTTFENCTFYNNRISDFEEDSRTVHLYKESKVSMKSEGHHLVFKNFMNFSCNLGTALSLISSTLTIDNNSKMLFDWNKGDYGGAIALYNASTVVLNENTSLDFSHNRATVFGGALYIPNNKNYSECQFSAGNNHSNSVHRTLKFFNNSMFTGRSIYTSSINNCNFTENAEVIQFLFTNSSYKNEISTDACIKPYKSKSPLEFIPGKGMKLPIIVQNDFELRVKRLIYIRLEQNETIILNKSLEYIFPEFEIILHGSTNSTDTLVLSLIQNEYSIPVVDFEVRLIPCPPGYRLQNGTCNCVNTYFIGVKKCLKKKFQVDVARLYWMGYDEQYKNNFRKYGLENNLYSCVCPQGYCHNVNISRDPITLPKNSSIEEMDQLMCGPNRTGFLCARCKKNHSVFFHSDHYKCFLNNSCSLGWIYFLLSEIIPATFLFLLIIMLNVQLTSGSVQGFIFYVQIFETLRITAHNQIKLSNSTSMALRVLLVTYRMLNLEFFTDDMLSFCLWKGATSLNIIAVKYIIIGYSLLLVLAVLFIWNKCNSKIRYFSHKSTRSSVVHGLSSFLVICYFQITKVSIMLLTPGTVYGMDKKFQYHVVFYDGSLKFFKGQHLAYAIPVIIVTSPFIIIPPLLLFVYPLCYKVFTFLHISETWFSNVICKIIPLERFKPFIDSFQSCFKDEYRYFAGLYFLYRLTTLLIFAVSHSLSAFYASLQVQLILMLLFHAWTMPYKTKWHNQLDAYIFATLAVINFLTLFILHVSLQLGEPTESISRISAIQIALGYLPIPVLVFQCFWGRKHLLQKWVLKILHKPAINLCSNKKENNEIFLNLQEDRDNMEMSSSYYMKK